jgi:LDH2 family malate/lactate/ureidoglycolate dehydrogenase
MTQTKVMTQETGLRIRAESLKRFCERVFQKLSVSEVDARIAAEVLVEADLRGVDSHGVARFHSFYVDRIRNGIVVPQPRERVAAETPATAVIDAGAGLGHPVSYRAMEKAIQKARDVGAGFVTVRNSNHFGIAGYYAMMALEHDCIGIAMTNSNPLIVPTFGRDALLGTNPIAVAAPAGQERPFVLDMATSVVPGGKLEVYDRLEKPIPLGWATDETGAPTTDAARVLDNIAQGVGGRLLPLGGTGELFGGHKGYGLALWVEIFCALLAGAFCSDQTFPRTADGKPLPSQVGHFFGAWRVDAFRPADEFKAAMDDLQRRLRNAPKAEGETRIYIHGEKEYEEAERRAREGIPLNPKVAADLRALAAEMGMEYDLD